VCALCMNVCECACSMFVNMYALCMNVRGVCVCVCVCVCV